MMICDVWGVVPARQISSPPLTPCRYGTLRKGPLPGGRQGPSGAGAGRDSMRTASRARGAARPPSRPSHPSSPPACLVSAGSSRAQQSAPATGGVRRMRWTTQMNSNALRAYFRAKGGETGGFAYRARMHRLFAELEPSVTVTEQNLADRVRYILRSNTFDGAELERLRREAVPSSDENAAAEGAAPQLAEQTAYVDAAENTPVVADSNDDGTVAQELELEQMRSTLEEAIVETRSTPLENRPRLPRLALSKRNRAVVRALNPMLVTYLEASRDLCETDSILFGAALAVCRIIGAKLSTAGRATGQSSAIPAWRTRIEERIAKARALIGRLICFRSGNTRPRIVRTVRMAFAGTNVSLSQPDIMQKLTERIDDLKQRIAAWGKRIRRYTERSTRFNQNRLFQSDQKRLYKSLERPIVSGTGPVPNQADMVAFWRSLWSEPVNHNEGPWTEVVASQCASITPMDPVTITPDDVAEAVRRAPNWKSPGLDGLHHYWLKGFVIHRRILRKAKQIAIQRKIESALNSIKEIWNIVNGSRKNSFRKKEENILLKLNNNIVSNKQDVANVFSSHFSETNSLSNNASDTNSAQLILKQSVQKIVTDMPFKIITSHEILKTVKEMENKRSHGYDEIPIKIIKDNIDILAESLAYLFNKCVEQSLLPDQLKVARVLPVHKKGSKMGVSPTSRTIIDHVATNFNNQKFHIAIIESSLSDHKNIYVEMKKVKPPRMQKLRYEATNYEILYKRTREHELENEDRNFGTLEEFIKKNLSESKEIKYKIINQPQKEWPAVSQ
ncbi:unnamed protein product [Parnassius apollo]|uniref:(apollo) hypothetical protein n=1 Tax=Parnassius apollo TaxID=110799 RepID=A0A8S3XIG8_PARAO|nr:unnamed protein product [Parnassius apollo]